MQGFKTVIVGALLAVAPTLTTYFGNVNWEDYFSPNVAFFVSGALMIVLRFVTTSPIFKTGE